MEITDDNLVRSDHPATLSVKESVYCKTCLPLRILDIQYLNKCINFELKIDEKLCTFAALYRSSSDSQDSIEIKLNQVNFEFDSTKLN